MLCVCDAGCGGIGGDDGAAVVVVVVVVGSGGVAAVVVSGSGAVWVGKVGAALGCAVGSVG